MFKTNQIKLGKNAQRIAIGSLMSRNTKLAIFLPSHRLRNTIYNSHQVPFSKTRQNKSSNDYSNSATSNGLISNEAKKALFLFNAPLYVTSLALATSVVFPDLLALSNTTAVILARMNLRCFFFSQCFMNGFHVVEVYTSRYENEEDMQEDSEDVSFYKFLVSGILAFVGVNLILSGFLESKFVLGLVGANFLSILQTYKQTRFFRAFALNNALGIICILVIYQCVQRNRNLFVLKDDRKRIEDLLLLEDIIEEDDRKMREENELMAKYELENKL